MGTKAQIYLLHAETEVALASALHGALGGQGEGVWAPGIDLQPGDDMYEVTERSIQEAGMVLLLFSPSGLDSWMERTQLWEAVQLRQKSGRRIVPCLLDGFPQERLPFGLGRLVPITASRSDLAPLVARVKALVGREDETPTAQVAPAPRVDVPAVDIDVLLQATIRRRLDRDLLLSWMSDEFRARLPHKASYFEQIQSDLTVMTKAGTLADGTRPIAVWLRQAERLAGPFAEARVYKAALDRLA